jgi:hypothetical protein
MERHLRRVSIAGVVLAVSLAAAAAEGMKSPRISQAVVDWDAIDAELSEIEALEPSAASTEKDRTTAAAARAVRLKRLNRAMDERFAGIAASPVPVLLPFETVADLRERTIRVSAPAAAANTPITNYLAGFHAVPFFYAGPNGYDAVVVARAQAMRELGIRLAKPVSIHISVSALIYEIDRPIGMIGWPVTGGLETQFPGIKRLFLENYVRYTFVRFGMPYTVAIECFDGGARYGKISCREADKIAVRALKALRFVGGTPRAQEEVVELKTIEQPEALSTGFTYHSPGHLLSGTGFRGRTGVSDYTVYSKLRFPLAEAPAFANSQSFMNWGNCEATGRVSMGMRGKTAAYRCRVNGQTLIRDESAPANYSYPWRDNFCEHRFFFVGQCPGGLGHQGQDIRPAFCKQRIAGANRCEPYLHDVVAARDGAVLRAPGTEALFIVVNTPNERLRFRYLHMQPKQFDADGMVSGRLVREGDVIGKVGNYFKRERATTYHLHFDIQVPTQHGWVFVNPYMTLVAAYERLIAARGRELKAPDIPEEKNKVPVASRPAQPLGDSAISKRASRPASSRSVPIPLARPRSIPTAAKPTETAIESSPGRQSGIGKRGDERAEEAASVTTSVPAVAGGGDDDDVQHHDAGTGEHVGVRELGSGVSRPGDRAGHFRRHLRPRDDRNQTRHRGL